MKTEKQLLDELEQKLLDLIQRRILDVIDRRTQAMIDKWFDHNLGGCPAQEQFIDLKAQILRDLGIWK